MVAETGKSKKARAVGINHVALEVSDIDKALKRVAFIRPHILLP